MKTWGEIKVMNDLKEQAKKIIAKGKALGDVELINMGLDMLEAIPELDIGQPTVEDKILQTTTNKKVYPKQLFDSRNITEQFRVENKTPIDTKYGKKIPVAVGARENKFIDDGVEAVDLIGKTPPSPPKQKRKVNKVEMLCQVCGKKEKVLKELVFSESYRCESCLMKGKTL